MKPLSEYIIEYEEKGLAIGHFNVSNLEILHGIYNAAKKISSEVGYSIPIIIGVSESESEFINNRDLYSVIKRIREEDNYPIFLNADHHYSFESVKEAMDIGFDSVIIDKVESSFLDNVKVTSDCVNYADELYNINGREVLVESEIGFIGKSSKLLDSLPDGVSKDTMTKPEEAKLFCESTKINLLAPSVGNIHGMVKNGNPKLDIERIRDIKKAVKIPLVLHGGSGISDSNFKDAIKAGISIIHINTEIRVAYRNALEEGLRENLNEIAPYKYLKKSVMAVEKVVYDKLKLFNNI